MRILITGGAGYIGSHVTKLLGEAGHDLVIVDNLSTGRKGSVLFGKLAVLDLCEHEKLNALFEQEKFEACFHFAGSIVVPESVSEPLKYYDNNTKNSLNLIKLCSDHKVNRFIFSSTAAVYGEGSPDGACGEDTALNPVNPYGRSKLMTEWMLEDYAACGDFNYVALRYFNVSGANVDLKIGQCTPNATHLIKIASECASGKRSSMSIFGDDYPTSDGTCVRDYIHIDDLAQAHVDALNYLDNNSKSEVLNCGYGHGYSVKEIIATVKKVTGADFDVSISPRREGDSAKLISKAERIKSTLGWKPRHDNIETIVKTAYEWEKKLK
jgi:UDP-glucose 4-epimerase